MLVISIVKASFSEIKLQGSFETKSDCGLVGVKVGCFSLSLWRATLGTIAVNSVASWQAEG